MRAAAWLAFSVPIGVVAACGSRTGLLVPPPEHDATAPDVAADVPEEPDVIEEPEAALDADGDAAEEDAPPMIEETVDICPDAGSTLIYLMTQQNVLMSFYPPTATFTTIGTIMCPAPANDTPFSMAVDRAGIAYVVFAPSGHLFRVSTRTAVCVPTSFVPGAFPPQFGMGFSANVTADGGGDAGETLYIAGDPGYPNTPGPSMLGSIDTATYTAKNMAAFTPVIEEPELTGTGAGKLYGFWAPDQTSDTAIVEIDKATAAVTTVTTLPGIVLGNGWAFAFWGGDFYTFTAPQGSGSSIVHRYRPSDGSIVQVATTQPGLIIVGAGVSTCAPQM